jgi:excinuclease UvrABC nuclease subunit
MNLEEKDTKKYNPHGSYMVYFLCKQSKVIYVGKTQRLEGRLEDHKKNGIPFNKVFYLTTTNKKEMDKLEKRMIHKYKPEFNKADKTEYTDFFGLSREEKKTPKPCKVEQRTTFDEIRNIIDKKLCQLDKTINGKK